jgi:tetratricopeptide (TPR) repeat protein
VNKPTSVCAVLLAFNLGACSTLGTRPGTTVMLGPELVEGIRQQVEVRQRLQGLEPGDPDYGRHTADLKAAKNRIWQFERHVIAAAVRYEQKQQWREADHIFIRALKYVPNSEILQAARKQMEERREAREQTLRAELSINEGEQLLKDARSYKQIAQLKPSSLLTRLEINAYQRKRRKVSTQLLSQGKLAIEHRDYALARRCLAIAERLDSTEEVRDALQLANARLNHNRRVGSLPQQALREGSLQAQIEQYQQSLAKGDLSLSRRQLIQLQQKFPDNPVIQTLEAELRILIEAKVAAASQHAKVLYSEGNVQQALSLWQEILPLDPDNPDLQLNISRAQRVLENLRALREKQSG